MKAALPNTSSATLPAILLETSPSDHRRHGARYQQIAAVDALVPLLATHVRYSHLRRQGDRGRVVIYRPTGEVLRIVEIPETIPAAALNAAS
jgi:hypothetical protein